MISDLFGLYRIFLFSGHYGSGKTEISVNFALRLADANRTAIVDFDIVNPYFRAADARAALENKGIRVIAPQFANTNVEAPALPAEIASLFDEKGVKAVFDVGGDAAGARAVSRYREDFAAERTAHFFVFNVRRPMTSTVDTLENIFNEIRDSARLPFTALVNNTNLLGMTSGPELNDGLDASLALSERLSLPVAFSTAMCGADESPAARAFYERSRTLGIDVFKLSKHILMG